jgi:hypothetical protein
VARKAFLYFWIASTLVSFFASTYSEFPNQIHWAYNASVFGMALVLLANRTFTLSGMREMLSLIFFYFSAFYVVSFWELFPGTTIEHGKFELINIIIAICGFIVGRNYEQRDMMMAYTYLAFVILLITALQLALDEEQIRYGYGIQLMLCLPAALLLKKYLLISCGLVFMLASHHKTPLVATVLVLTIVYLCSRNGKDNISVPSFEDEASSKKLKQEPYLDASMAILSVIIGLVIFAINFDEILLTVARFLPEGSFNILGVTVEAEEVDASREYLVLNTVLLLPDYFIQGMGYMNFYVWSGPDTGVYLSRLDREVAGTNIHNSYMTWALEGGILVMSVVVLMVYRTARQIWRILTSKSSRAVGLLLLSSFTALMFTAAFHQVHSTMQFWASIGLIFGYAEQLPKRRASVVIPAIQDNSLLRPAHS